MRSKAPLVMMEQMIMLLVFALAAVLCLQAFTTSREISVVAFLMRAFAVPER